MKLISMKNKPKTTLRKAKEVAMAEPYELDYPWGLEVSLDSGSIKKLGIDAENLNAGDTVYFTAKAKISRVSQSQNIDETGKTKKDNDLGMQITDMSWGKSDKNM